MNPLDPKLLEPVSEAQPCGPDYSYDPKLDELETILKGKPEVEIGSVQRPAEPPDWVELMDKSKSFLAESKHLRVATMLCCSLLKTQGLPGLRDGLQLIKIWLEKYWPTLYPLLDAEDNNDPTQRLNILGVLTAPRGSVSGWLAIVDNLYAADFYRSRGAAPITFDQVIAAKAPTADSPDTAKLAAGIKDVDKISVAHQEVLHECHETVRQIDQLLTSHLGSGGTISFEVLEKTLQELESALKPFLPGAAAEPGAAGEGAAATGSGGGSPGMSIGGPIRSREDVVRALEGICNYYKQIEPGSPVPYLLRRAQMLARMDFVQAMQELNLATVETLRPSMGSAVGESAPATPAEPT
jgi:type VI secretion system protein ImpA